MNIYTKRGDSGETDLFGGGRVPGLNNGCECVKLTIVGANPCARPNVTLSQIKEAYRQVCEAEAEHDWIYEPEVVAEVVSRAKAARKELASGKTKSWDEFGKKLGV